MTAIETLDDVYAALADKADDGTCTEQEQSMLLHAAADVRFRKLALEMIEQEKEYRALLGPVGPIFAFGTAGAVAL
jgi:hypothetical protein